MADVFEILVPPDAKLMAAIRTALAKEPSIQFTEGTYGPLIESTNAAEQILAFLLCFPTAKELIAAMRHLPAIIKQSQRGRSVQIKAGSVQIKLDSSQDIDAAVSGAIALLLAQEKKRPKGSK